MFFSLVSSLTFVGGMALAGPVAAPASDGLSASEPVAAASTASIPSGRLPYHGAGRVRPVRGRVLPQAPADLFPEIDQVALRVWTVDRSLVEVYAGDLDAIDRLARARRHRTLEGEINGYYIDRIRKTNPLYDAGLRNGDVIHAVNGSPTRNTVQVLWAFTRHRKAEVVRVELTRKDGRRMTLTYLLG